MLREGVSVLFLRRPSTSAVKGKIWRVVVVFLGGTLWRSLIIGLIVSLRVGRTCLRYLLDKTEDLSERESEAWVVVPVVLDVTDVPVSPSFGGD